MTVEEILDRLGDRNDPAAPADEIWTELRGQFVALMSFAGLLAVMGWVIWLVGDSSIAVALFATAVGTLLILGVALLFLSSWRRKIGRIAGGDYLVHWEYDDATWRKLLKTKDRRKQKLILWCASLGMPPICAIGLVLGIVDQVRRDGDAISPLFHVLFPLAVAIALGALFAAEFHRQMNRHDARRRSATGRAIIGREDLYIPGEFWPWSSFGQGLAKVEYEASNQLLVFTFGTSARYTMSYEAVNVAVPQGEEGTAKDIAALFE